MEKGTKEMMLKAIFSPIGIIGAIVIAFFLIDHLLKGYILGEEDKYAFFKDILIINLAIMGLSFGAIVFWIQQYIKEDVKNRVKEEVKEDVDDASIGRDKENLHFVQGIALLNDGYTSWLTYDATKKENVLDAAILQTRMAFDFFTDLDDTHPGYVKAKGDTKNNLGYYLAARGKFKDKAEAIMYAQDIKKKAEAFPAYSKEWMHTYNYIMSRKWEGAPPL